MSKKNWIWCVFLLSVLCFSLGTVSAFQQQWFTAYQEWYNSSLTFACESQCFVLLWTLGGNNYLNLQGTLDGQWTVGFGFLVGQQIAPWPMMNIQWQWKLDQKFSFSDVPVYPQIPKEAQIVLLVQGNVKGSEVLANLRYFSFSEKLSQWWKDFWKMEPMTPYSINLRYGVKILGTSIVKYGYRIFVLLSLYIWLFKKNTKENKKNLILYLGIGIFLFIGLRNFITNYSIINQGLQWYVSQAWNNKTFFDLGDYISFTDQVRKKLDLDTILPGHVKSCKIQVNVFQDWPFKAHMGSVYLKPCELVLTWSEADYVVYYHMPIGSGDANKESLLQFNDNYLLKNK
jgi:hypothetical protein